MGLLTRAVDQNVSYTMLLTRAMKYSQQM
ncbi:hypothetical protein F383_34812 [Gossypium arboreum]|uniref:Uncharacterized protein n=1 Tax=Gossypium arboreum TaxID=29729 RepID=A0A0B0PYU2_GOSAR|nr:hypothetical protein F383_34812 [Gossypium arboreum]